MCSQLADPDPAVHKSPCQILTKPTFSECNVGADDVCCDAKRGIGFFEYYQIDRGDEDDISEESGSGRSGESTVLGLHSLWGTILSLQEKIGCTHDYILWGESWLNIQMKISDSARVGKRKKHIETEDELREFLKIHN